MNKIYFPCDTDTLRPLASLSLERHKRQIYDLIFYYWPGIFFSFANRNVQAQYNQMSAPETNKATSPRCTEDMKV